MSKLYTDAQKEAVRARIDRAIDKGVPPSRLAGVQEVCENVGITRRGLKNWRDRNGFPEPVATLAAGPVWDMRDVEKWVDERRRPK